MRFVWLILLVIFIVYMIGHDSQIKNTKEYTDAISNGTKPPVKLISKNWIAWIFIALLIFIDFRSFKANNLRREEAYKAEQQQIVKKRAKAKKEKANQLKKKKENAKKSKEKAADIKDSQTNMSDELYSNSTLKQFVTKIKYRGDGEADIVVNSDFINLSDQQKNAIAKKVNNLVTSYVEDVEAFSNGPDPYSFLTFIATNNKLIGHSKQFSHNEYKWDK